MSKTIQFGEDVEGYNIRVLNEREVRAAAGILFFFTYTSLMLILMKGNFLMIKYVITLFLTDFIIRVFISPRYSPTLILGRLIVRNQVPEYVGARQKKFAWIIGVILSATMFILLVVVNAFSVITGLVCLVCLIFLFFEAVFGICLGCKFYPLFFKDKVQFCPGEVCDVKDKQEIQKTSTAQILIIFGFIAYLLLTGYLFNTEFGKKPYNLFGKTHSSQSGSAPAK
jgi:hypothetical protein